MQILLKNTAEYMFFNKEDVDMFEEKLRTDASANGYALQTYTWTEKFVKEKGEIVDNYFVVKAITKFNDPKNLEVPAIDVDFTFRYDIDMDGVF